ncbi:MAG: hypothetical protein KDB23_31520, partial [Planctomycetales bacterium]|nr:hypothetical protein [Planctomycetales bacterium]
VKLTAAQNANSAADVFDDDLLDEMLPELDERPAGRAPTGNTAPEADAFDDLPLTNDDAGDAGDVFPEPELPASDSGSSRFADDLPDEDLSLPVDDAPAAEADSTDSIFGEQDLSDSDLPTMDDEPTVPAREPDRIFPSPSDRTAPADEDLPEPSAPSPRSDSSTADEDISDEPDAYEIFNGRNCDEEISTLQEAWENLRRRPLKSISLDISPTIRPNEDAAENERGRQEVIAKAPTREWRDQSGRVIARGKMSNLKNSHVLVEDESGQVKKISWYDLSNEDLCFVTAWWELPSEYLPPRGHYQVRDWTRMTFTWKASGLCHKPLYFEEVALERYGHSAEPVTQAFLSGAHFFGNIFFLPYKMGLNPPNECQYSLGYYRPGSCAPWLLPAVPLDARAARMQVGAITGGLTLLP